MSIIFTIAIVAIMFIIAGFYYIKCIVPLNKVVQNISIIRNELSKYDVVSSSEHYQDIDDLFNNNESLKEVWEDYSKTLINVDTFEGETIKYSTELAEDYFNMSIICSHVNLMFWQNLGGIFTGIGILGTFAGLTLGIQQIDITSSDIGVLKNGIGSLLSGLSTAFITSLMGITLAIIFSWIHKTSTEKAELAIKILSRKISSLFTRKISEQWLAELSIHSREQTDQLREFSSSLGVAIGDGVNLLISQMAESRTSDQIENIDITLSEIKSYMCEDLSASINNVTPILNSISEGINQIVKGAAESISDTLTDGVSRELGGLSKSIEDMNHTLEITLSQIVETSKTVDNNLTQSIHKVIYSLNESIAEIAKQSDLQKQSMVESSKQLNIQIGTALSSITKEMQMILEAYKDDARKNSEALSEASIMSMNKLIEASQKIDENLSGIVSNVIGEMNNSVVNIAEQSRNQQNTLIKTNDIVNRKMEETMTVIAGEMSLLFSKYKAETKQQNTQLITAISNMTENMQFFMDNAGNALKNQQNTLSEITKELSELQGNTQAIITSAKEAAKEFERASIPVKNAAGNLDHSIENIVEVNREYDRNIKDNINSLKDTARSSEEVIKDLITGLEETQRNWQAYSKHFENVNGELTGLMETIQSNLNNFTRIINDSYSSSLKEYSQTMANACGALTTIFDNVQETQNDIMDGIEYIKRGRK